VFNAINEKSDFMQKIEKSAKKTNYFLPLLILFILADVICDNFILQSFNKQSSNLEFWLFICLLLLQVFAAPLQAGFSDFYCRKKSLVVSLFFSLLALTLIFLYSQHAFFFPAVLFMIVIIKGLFGNTIPLSRAAIADTQQKNFRFSFGLSSASFAVAYLLLIAANKYITEAESNFYIIIFYSVLLFLCIRIFKDIRDKTTFKSHGIDRKTENLPILKSTINLIKIEFSLILKDICHKDTYKSLIAFLLWEISLYCILILYVDFSVKEFSSIAVSMMIGYLSGIFTLKFCRKTKDKTMIKIGYNISALSLVPFFIFIPIFNEINLYLLNVGYFFHTFGNAFLCPTLFAILSKDRKPHEQGKIYGLIESTDTIAFLFASIAVMLYNLMQLQLIYIIGFSFLTVAISWFPWKGFEKSRSMSYEK
jgi:MFS family permease